VNILGILRNGNQVAIYILLKAIPLDGFLVSMNIDYNHGYSSSGATNFRLRPISQRKEVRFYGKRKHTGTDQEADSKC
jgi:hypothetical protein